MTRRYGFWKAWSIARSSFLREADKYNEKIYGIAGNSAEILEF
jgi:hypothetical protein